MIIINKKRTNEIIISLEGCIDMQDIDVNSYFHELRQMGKRLEKSSNLNEIFKFINALGNKERLKIIEILKNNDHCVCELETILDKSQPSISHHLRILESIGLIRSFKKGKFTHYELVKDQFNEYLGLINEQFK